MHNSLIIRRKHFTADNFPRRNLQLNVKGRDDLSPPFRKFLVTLHFFLMSSVGFTLSVRASTIS